MTVAMLILSVVLAECGNFVSWNNLLQIPKRYRFVSFHVSFIRLFADVQEIHPPLRRFINQQLRKRVGEEEESSLSHLGTASSLENVQ